MLWQPTQLIEDHVILDRLTPHLQFLCHQQAQSQGKNHGLDHSAWEGNLQRMSSEVWGLEGKASINSSLQEMGKVLILEKSLICPVTMEINQ